jgi:dTDP-glucose pyrophosphorylase
MWGVIPAAGIGSRIQPIAFSKELLPVGSRIEGGSERPRAVSEYLIARMIAGGATKLCFVISPGKSDILQYYSQYYSPGIAGVEIVYVVQSQPKGLCDAVFRALPVISADEPVLVGLPDTIWFPEDGLALLPDNLLSFLLFPVGSPELFDVVLTEEDGMTVKEILVKTPNPPSHWIWGAFKMPGSIFRQLHTLWREPDRGDEYFGTLVNAYLARGGTAIGISAGEAYVDVGTIHGYREALRVLADRSAENMVLHAGRPRPAPVRPTGLAELTGL